MEGNKEYSMNSIDSWKKRGKNTKENVWANRKQQHNKTIEISLHIYLTPIKVNELNFPIQRQRLPDCIKI